MITTIPTRNAQFYDSLPENDWKSREISNIVINTASCAIQGVHFIVSISTAVVTVDLSHRKPASAENLDHFKTPLRNKERCSSRGGKKTKIPG
jgi:hypothetical protein